MTESPDVYPDVPDDDESARPDDGVEARLGPDEPSSALRTGDPRVDEVLESLAHLDDLAVGEHAAVFEAAHERLRAALEPDRESA